jgi:hypothetical protein
LSQFIIVAARLKVGFFLRLCLRSFFSRQRLTFLRPIFSGQPLIASAKLVFWAVATEKFSVLLLDINSAACFMASHYFDRRCFRKDRLGEVRFSGEAWCYGFSAMREWRCRVNYPISPSSFPSSGRECMRTHALGHQSRPAQKSIKCTDTNSRHQI